MHSTSGSKRPATARRTVDLPAPLAPVTSKNMAREDRTGLPILRQPDATRWPVLHPPVRPLPDRKHRHGCDGVAQPNAQRTGLERVVIGEYQGPSHERLESSSVAIAVLLSSVASRCRRDRTTSPGAPFDDGRFCPSSA